MSNILSPLDTTGKNLRANYACLQMSPYPSLSITPSPGWDKTRKRNAERNAEADSVSGFRKRG